MSMLLIVRKRGSVVPELNMMELIMLSTAEI